ncbi:MAG: S-adenosyl-l-methionine hydroxide adenosyltransferase family protein [Phycisphaerae bacterium]
MSGLITLITDFGDADHYVACMKGVILQRTPQARIIDVTHRIRPQDPFAAAFVLRHVFPCFPAGTLHVAVVDPGVGGPRRILAGRYARQTLLVPDNGILSLVHRDFEPESLRSVENSALMLSDPSATFHGRDIFAPVASALSSGLDVEQVGPAAPEPVLLDIERPTQLESGGLQGRIVYVDRFGNLISNISEEDLRSLGRSKVRFSVILGSTPLGTLRSTYSDVPIGAHLALIGSTGMLEVAINQGNAAARLNATPGTALVVR